MSVLVARQLTVNRGRTEVIHGIDLRVEAGEVIAVLGSNGAGKSTLLAALAGIIPLSTGSLERHGRVAIGLQSEALARRSVRANVELALAWWGVPGAQRKARALDALRSMRADHLADRSAASLSGGERRRVHLARAVAVNADLLLLDEPFSALDTQTRDDLIAELARLLHQTAGAAVVVVHDRDEAWALATRVVVLIDGRVAADGTPAALLSQPPSAEVARFLGFSGELRQPGGERLLLRPTHVVVSPDGQHHGRVSARIGTTDGVRLDIELPDGRVQANVGLPAAQLGDEVRVDICGGVVFAGDGHADRGGT